MNTLTIKRIEEQTLKRFATTGSAEPITSEDLKDKTRKGRICRPRHIIWLIASKTFKVPVVCIAKYYKRDHSSVIKVVNKIKEEATFNKELQNEIDLISTALN